MRLLLRFAFPAKGEGNNLLFAMLASMLIVIATGVVVGASRVELASPFTARLVAVQVFFHDGVTGKYVNPNAVQLLPLALQGRLGYEAEIRRQKPNFVPAIFQSLLAWLSLWLALGLSLWLIKRSLTTYQWWQIGLLTGSLMIWRLLQALTVSCWLWLPHWNLELVIALLDILQGRPVPTHLVFAVLWRGSLWLLMGIATLIHILAIMQRSFEFSRKASLLGLIVTYIFAKLVYALSTASW